MPPTVGGDNQYRIKSLHNGHERVVKESDLVDGLIPDHRAQEHCSATDPGPAFGTMGEFKRTTRVSARSLATTDRRDRAASVRFQRARPADISRHDRLDRFRLDAEFPETWQDPTR